MMTIEEAIKSLQEQVKQDIVAAEALQKAECYSQALFWAHLVLEKMCKALWVKKNNKAEYPFTHNLLRLFKECNVELNEEQTKFYSDMNLFQSLGRYDDSIQTIEDTISEKVCQEFMNQFKIEYQWILIQIQEK
jgi:HEPN domain-containing protein